jgi:hypothetical protein
MSRFASGHYLQIFLMHLTTKRNADDWYLLLCYRKDKNCNNHWPVLIKSGNRIWLPDIALAHVHYSKHIRCVTKSNSITFCWVTLSHVIKETATLCYHLYRYYNCVHMLMLVVRV